MSPDEDAPGIDPRHRPVPGASSRRPNILLVTTDQQHFRALGRLDAVLQTPHLDRLAGEGTVFDRAYCPNPLCSPSRASIITGQYPSTHGCWTIGTKLDEDRQTLGALLGDAGYRTSLIGKAHFQPIASRPDQTSLEAPPRLRDLDFWRDFHGPYYGFDHIELARNHGDEGWVGQHYALWMEEHGLANWRDYFRAADNTGPRRQYSWDLPEEFHYTTFVTDRTLAAIDDARDTGQPFFTWASYHDPHPPYLVSEPWASMYDPADITPPHLDPGELDAMPEWFQLTQQDRPDFSRWQETPYANHGFHSHLVDEATLRRNIAVYYGMISLIDSGIGRILNHLDEAGLAQNTLIVFTTDHGHFLGQHGLTAKGPFHYEDLIRIPMIARYPEHIPAGTQTTALQSLIDIAPTLLTAASIPVPLDMQGADQWPVWTGSTQAARDHTLVENRHQPTAVHIRTYVDDRYKLTAYHDRTDGELYDLANDPAEHHNLHNDPAAAALLSEVRARLIDAELHRETSRYPRIANA